jgi:PAS domain S-box-containing protein
MQATKRHRLLDYNENDLFDLLKRNVILSITDTLGRITYANNNYCKITGFQRDELLGEAHSLIKSELHASPFYKNLWATIKSGEIWKGVLTNGNTFRHQFWLDTTITPIKDDNGNVIKYVSVYVDVTSCYYENQQLKTKQQNLKTFIDNIPNVILSINKSGAILNINHELENSSIEDIIGSPLYKYIHVQYHNAVKDCISFVFKEGKPCKYETTQKDADGSIKHYVSQIAPIFNAQGVITSANISMQDVTRFKNLKAELKKREAKYKTLFQTVNIGIIVVANSEGNITEWNKGAELAFGYKESEVRGKPLTILMADQYREASIKELLRVVKKLKGPLDNELIELQGMRKDGSLFPLEFALSKWNIEKRRYYCAVMLDISKRKSLESKLKLKSNDLELFLYRSAHDLKAPFSSAEGLINLIKQENINSNVENLTDMLEVTLEKGKQLLENLTLASGISAKSKITSPVNFKEIVYDVLKTLSGIEYFEHIKFQTNIKTPVKFNSNPELLNSILINLVQNAVKYSKHPLINHEPFVNIEVQTSKESVFIKVVDNGRGIEKENIDKVFDLYFRASDEEVPGSGLGLYIVKNIVDDLNGTITVTSELNEGASFEITLPNLKKIDRKNE